jgi:HK97 gp10 family phage protein
MGIELTGMQEMRNKLQAIGKNIAEAEDKALEAGAEVIKKEVIARTPVGVGNEDGRGFGHLNKHIVISETKIDGNGVRYKDVGPSKGKGFKGVFLEFGTVKMRAHPFVEPAYLSKKEDALEAMADVMREVISNV